MINRGSPSHVDTGLGGRDDCFHFTSPRDHTEWQLLARPPKHHIHVFFSSPALPAILPPFPPGFIPSRHFFIRAIHPPLFCSLGEFSLCHVCSPLELLSTLPLPGEEESFSFPKECVPSVSLPGKDECFSFPNVCVFLGKAHSMTFPKTREGSPLHFSHYFFWWCLFSLFFGAPCQRGASFLAPTTGSLLTSSSSFFHLGLLCWWICECQGCCPLITSSISVNPSPPTWSLLITHTS